MVRVKCKERIFHSAEEKPEYTWPSLMAFRPMKDDKVLSKEGAEGVVIEIQHSYGETRKDPVAVVLLDVKYPVRLTDQIDVVDTEANL